MYKQAEILQQQLNTGETTPQLKEQLFKVKPMEGTPFHILNKDGIFHLTLGNQLLTSGHNTEEQLQSYIEQNKWNIITTIILILIDKEKNNQLTEKPKQNGNN